MNYRVAQVRARKGARLLDRVRPDWYAEIDIDQLDLADWESCILGQLYGSFAGGREIVLGEDSHNEQATPHGFFWPGTADKGEYGPNHDRLKRAWAEEIYIRGSGSEA